MCVHVLGYFFLLGILARKSCVFYLQFRFSFTSLENEKNARNLWLPVK